MGDPTLGPSEEEMGIKNETTADPAETPTEDAAAVIPQAAAAEPHEALLTDDSPVMPLDAGDGGISEGPMSAGGGSSNYERPVPHGGGGDGHSGQGGESIVSTGKNFVRELAGLVDKDSGLEELYKTDKILPIGEVLPGNK